MSVVIKHKKHSNKPDGTDASVVQPTDWNEEHAVQMAGPALVGKSDLGNGDAEEIEVGDGLKLENGQLKLDRSDLATAAQGTKADTAVQPAALTAGLATKLDQSAAAGFATAAQGTKADTAVQPAALTAGLATKLDQSAAAGFATAAQGEKADAAAQRLQHGFSILNGASSGANSGWLPISMAPERFAYALDSGSATTTFSVDISADGINSIGQAFTGTWARSDLAEITPAVMFSNPQAQFFRWNVLSGGPLSVKRGM